MVTSAKKIAELMNKFFIEKVENIRSKIPNIAPDLQQCKAIMAAKRGRVVLSHVTIKRVKFHLRNLKNTRSCSVDGLDNFCLKISADIIAKPIHHIITLLIMQSKFPAAWKLAKIVPVHKKGVLTDMKNYRPIAILTPLSKILEKIVYDQLYKHFEKK